MAWRFIPVLLGLLVIVTLSVTSALAASSAIRPGCPVITRAQAEAALGDVKKIEHHTQHTAGVGKGITWLERCTIHFGPRYKGVSPSRFGGSVDVVFTGNEREDFDEERRGLAAQGKVTVVRGLGKAAFRYTEDPSYPEWELYVFHPSKASPTPGLPPRPGEGAGSFVVLPDPSVKVNLPFQSLVALARAALKHPIRPL